MSLTLVFVVLAFLYLLLIAKAGKTYAILYLFIFIYFLQYIFSPYLSYTFYKVLGDQMPISQEEYFNYTVPALIFLFSGILLFKRDVDISRALKRINPTEATSYGFMLIVISYSLDFISYLGLSYFNSVISFTSYFKFLGAFCLLFGNSRLRYPIIGVIYLLLAVSVLRAGVFINFFIWSLFLFFFITLKFNIPFSLRASFIVLSLPVLFMIQGVKHEYRQITWKGKQEGGVELLTDLAQKRKLDDANLDYSKTSGVVRTVGRLNQGWHVGLTLRHVPGKEPFANGKEMMNDVVASLLPRIVFSGKKEVNSQEKFNKYTGHLLTGKTSMSIGLLGDFYINYGWGGSFVMLFVFGALIALFLNFFVRRYILPNPINVIWIPFILSYLIRANNDFYIFFNCMIKGFVIFLAVDYYRYKILRPRPVRRRVAPRPVTT